MIPQEFLDMAKALEDNPGSSADCDIITRHSIDGHATCSIEFEAGRYHIVSALGITRCSQFILDWAAADGACIVAVSGTEAVMNIDPRDWSAEIYDKDGCPEAVE